MRFLGAVVVLTALSDPQVTETALQRGTTKTLLKTEALDRLTQLLS
jgi:DNA-binding NarL/FixJ family response regulator